MTTPHQSHAAMLQLIAEGMRSTAPDRLQPSQLDRIAGLLDHIAVDLLVPTPTDAPQPKGRLVWELAPYGRLRHRARHRLAAR